MERNDYIHIQAYMVSDLGLSGNSLIIYALIHGYCKDGFQEFKGSINYICEWTGLSRNTVISILKQLVDDGLLYKRMYTQNNVVFCAYSLGSAKIALPVQKDDGGSSKIAPNNTNDNTIIKNDKDKSLSKKTRNSYDEDFEKAWVLAQRKGSKQDAYKYWKRLKDIDREKVIKHLPFYYKSNDRQYLKDFSGYLNHCYYGNVVYDKQGNVLFDPERENSKAYNPICGANLMWNDFYNTYVYLGYWDGVHIYDGYKDDDRPDGAKIMLNNGQVRLTWSKETQTWNK